MFWDHDLDFQGHSGHKGQIWSLEHDSISFGAINLKFGTGAYLGSGKMSSPFEMSILSFGVTKCKKVKNTFAITIP